jgi:N-acetylmuramoyl-L-alanine amidase
MLAFFAAAALVAPAPSPAPAPAAVPRPPIHAWRIPFGARRRSEMAAYSARHYGARTWRLRRPRVIVEHVAVSGSARAVRATFAPDTPDPELGELPNVCSQLVVNAEGAIFSLVPVSIRCRHTVGLNWTAIGIEHVGFRDADVLGRRRQLQASLRLTRWLRCRFHIAVRDVIGHAESLSSPFHRERVARLRRQTHADMQPAAMRRYRAGLARLGRCPS